jgi:hypothetical protein
MATAVVPKLLNCCYNGTVKVILWWQITNQSHNGLPIARGLCRCI